MKLPAVLSFALLFASTQAHAGRALSKVVHGMKQQSGQTSRPSPPGNSSPGSDSGSSSDSSYSSGFDNDYTSDDVAGSGGSFARGVHYGSPPPSGSPGDTQLDLYIGVQRVQNSDGAAVMAARAAYGRFGLEIADTSFYERVMTRDGRETLSLHAWTLAGQVRVIEPDDDEAVTLWVTAGLAGLSSDGLSLLGGVAGVRGTYLLTRHVNLETQIRLLLYQDDINGVELRTGVKVSLLSLSYRVTKFSTGPSLQGPEVGLGFSF